MKWNRNELQGRSRRQVKNNYKVFEYSLILLILGLIMIIFGVRTGETISWMEGGIVTFSWGFALAAYLIAVDSARKTKAQINVQFLQVVNALEDVRAYFIGGIYLPELFGWKTKNTIEMATELLKRDKKQSYIEPDYQDKLFHYFNISFKHLFKYPKWDKETSAISRFIESYAMLEDYYNDLRKDELKKFIAEEPKMKDFYKKVAEFKETLEK